MVKEKLIIYMLKTEMIVEMFKDKLVIYMLKTESIYSGNFAR